MTSKLRNAIALPGAVEALNRITPEQDTKSEKGWAGSVLRKFSRGTLKALIERGESPLGGFNPALQMAYQMSLSGLLRPRLVCALVESGVSKRTAENNATFAIKTLVDLELAEARGSQYVATVRPSPQFQN